MFLPESWLHAIEDGGFWMAAMARLGWKILGCRIFEVMLLMAFVSVLVKFSLLSSHVGGGGINGATREVKKLIMQTSKDYWARKAQRIVFEREASGAAMPKGVLEKYPTPEIWMKPNSDSPHRCITRHSGNGIRTGSKRNGGLNQMATGIIFVYVFMAHPTLLMAGALSLLALSPTASAATVERYFYVKNLTVTRVCKTQVIVAVNGRFPGPTIRVREGDRLIMHVINKSPYNVTIHWHGVRQLLTGWADGADSITQCPILPGKKYTYKFNVKGQEGTLWWHAHSSWLRATVHGALIIKPRACNSYPFPKPHGEFPLFLGEYWSTDVVDVERDSIASGGFPKDADAFTINGLPGNIYPCSQEQTYGIDVEPGMTYLFRIINAAMNNMFFLKIANHTFTVVAIDGGYTEPYATDVVVTYPGQTVDALVTMNRSDAGCSFYMAARPYISAPGIPFTNTTTVAKLNYKRKPKCSEEPKMPDLEEFSDTETAYRFSSSLLGLTNSRTWLPPPEEVDRRLFVTMGLGLLECDPKGPNGTCEGILGRRMAASLNNQSYKATGRLSMLEAFVDRVVGVFTEDFPSTPPVTFNYTDTALTEDLSLVMTSKSARVTHLKFNETVEIVLQSTALVVAESHPMHLHGYNMHLMAQGFGNFDPIRDEKKYNHINPQQRNTIGVPLRGWAVIRFQADNPGVWFFHCHLDAHMTWGLSTAFLVDNGTTPETTLHPRPADYPTC